MNKVVKSILSKSVVISLFCIASVFCAAQRLFVNVTGGMINYAGDLQAKHFTFEQAHPALGIG